MNSDKDIEKESDLADISPAPSSSTKYDLTMPSRPHKSKLNKTTYILVIILILIIGGGFFTLKNTGLIKKIGIGGATPTSTPASTSQPTPTPQALNRTEWSFEVLNGSGVTGAAKKIADSIKTLGYQVVKSGNADNQDFAQTQIFIKSDLQSKSDMVIADLKDVIKIASYAGELKDSTASARIIIGKDGI